jgi:hypothetical protein
MRWRPGYVSGPGIETACGYCTGTLDQERQRLRVTDDPGEDACRRCARR